MIKFHAVMNVAFEAKDLRDAFEKLVAIVQSRRNYVDTDDETQLEINGVSLVGSIDVHRADQCPGDMDSAPEEKEPWQQ